MAPREDAPTDAPRDGRVPAQDMGMGLENGAPGGNRTSVRPGTANAVQRTGPGNGHGGGVEMTPWLAIAVVRVPAGIRSRTVSGDPPAAGDGGSGIEGWRAMLVIAGQAVIRNARHLLTMVLPLESPFL